MMMVMEWDKKCFLSLAHSNTHLLQHIKLIVVILFLHHFIISLAYNDMHSSRSFSVLLSVHHSDPTLRIRTH